MVHLKQVMDQSIKASGLLIKFMALEFIFGQISDNTSVIASMGCFTVLVDTLGPMEEFTKDSIKTIKNTVLVSIHGLMATNIGDIGKKDIKMV